MGSQGRKGSRHEGSGTAGAATDATNRESENEATESNRTTDLEDASARGKVDAELLAEIQRDPDGLLHCIVMADDGLERLESDMPATLEIEHRYPLIQSMSVTGAASAFLELSRLPCVKSIEPVRPVAAR